MTTTPQEVESDVSFHVLDVTPEMAQLWLGYNTANRKLKPDQIVAYAEDMKAGRWLQNGEAIKFAGPAFHPTKLLDGQNRLHAVLRSGVTVTMTAAFGVDESAQITMDSGSKRTVSDNLLIAGVKNSTYVAAAANIAIKVESGRVLESGVKATNSAVEAYIRANPGLLRAGEVASQFYRRSDTPPSIIGYSFYVLARIDPEAAYTFWRDAADKVGLEAGDPVIALSNFFADARRDRRRIPVNVALSAVFRAWNARRDHRTLSVIKTRQNGRIIDIPQPK